MRTQALRVTVGAYENGEWHATFIEDTYERGVLINSELLIGPIYCDWSRVTRTTGELLQRLKERELIRLALPAAG